MAGENAPPAGFAKVNAELVLDLQARWPVRPATIDVDATIISCDKRTAKRTYEGCYDHQPVLMLWAVQE